MPTVTVNDVTLYYELHGAGEALLLIMGLGANTTGWYGQIEELSREYQLIAFDNRGCGRSDKPDVPYSIPQMADDAAGLLDGLGIASAHVFGMSMGGMIAQELALRHPQKVRSLILGATPPGGRESVMAGRQLIQQWMSTATLPMPQAIENGLAFLYSETFIAENKEQLVQRALESMRLMSPPYALQRQVMAVLSFDACARLTDIKVPALVLTGTDDQIVPCANSRTLAERIPDARLIEFPGVGHGFLIEKASEINAAVLEFLREGAASSARGPR